MIDVYEVEPWVYSLDGIKYEGRRVWHVESPGPTGCGIAYHEMDSANVLADDGVWERHVYSWALHTEPCTVPECLGFE